MASLFAMENEHRVEKIILLAPAINVIRSYGLKSKKISVPVRVYHGTNDGVIPLAEVDSMAREIFTDLSFNEVDDDHFLHKTFKSLEWDDLLA